MAQAKRDNNRVVTLIGVTSSGEILNATIDGVSGYLNMVVGAIGSGPASQIFQQAKRDQNRVTARIAVMEDGVTQGILTDDDGYLYVQQI